MYLLFIIYGNTRPDGIVIGFLKGVALPSITLSDGTHDDDEIFTRWVLCMRDRPSPAQ